MKNLDDLKKEIDKLKEELKEEVSTDDEEIRRKTDELLEKFFDDNKKSIFTIFIKQFLFNLFMLFLSFSVVYAFFVNIFSLENRWFILLLFFLLSVLISTERFLCRGFRIVGFNYIFCVLGLFNITLFTIINYFVNFTNDLMMFNILYILGIVFYTFFHFMLLRHKFREAK